MYETSCKLIKKKIEKNEIGVEKSTKEEIEIPIIKIENVYAKECYEANQAGFQPTLRIKVSALNYNNEEEVIYKGTTYTIIRNDEANPDEVTLICERKINNVQNN